MALLKKYQNGGTAPTITVKPKTKTSKVYEGGEGWDKYKAYKASNDLYNQSQDSLNFYASDTAENPFSKTQGGTGSNAYTINQFNKQNTGIAAPTDATGVTRYSRQIAFRPNSSQTPEQSVQRTDAQGNIIEGSMPTTVPKGDAGTQYGYTFTYDKPEGNYEVVESPEVIAKREADRVSQLKWDAFTKDYSGYKTETYKYADAFGSKESHTPWASSQGDLPTTGAYKPYGSSAPSNFQYPSNWNYTPAKKRGGLLSFKKGGLLYNTKELVKFGNYLLSKERKGRVSKISRDSVGHWDLENFKIGEKK